MPFNHVCATRKTQFSNGSQRGFSLRSRSSPANSNAISFTTPTATCKIIGTFQRFSTAFSASLLLNPVGACFNYFASRSTCTITDSPFPCFQRLRSSKIVLKTVEELLQRFWFFFQPSNTTFSNIVAYVRIAVELFFFFF
jgi:hypothetical protein